MSGEPLKVQLKPEDVRRVWLTQEQIATIVAGGEVTLAPGIPGYRAVVDTADHVNLFYEYHYEKVEYVVSDETGTSHVNLENAAKVWEP